VRHLEKMTGHTRLYRRRATYYHRAAVPQYIQETYGKREETFSLRTKDRAEALTRVRVEAVRVDKLFAQHRRDQSRVTLSAPNPALDELTPDQIAIVKRT
jgi:hypothetical protein